MHAESRPLANISAAVRVDPFLPSSVFQSPPLDTPTALRLPSQQSILRNSLLNKGFIPA